MGSLIDIVGSLSHMLSGLSISATVADALRPDGWWLAHSRSRNPTLVLLKNCLPDASPIMQCENDDTYLWKCGNSPPMDNFSTSETWRTLHPQGAVVPWYDQVWFSGHIPKHVFITWIVARDRLSTRDRLFHWGLQVPSVCILCNASDENRQHLFFNFQYSRKCGLSFVAGCISLHPLSLKMV